MMSRRILLVEDDRELGALLEQYLGDNGFVVDRVLRGDTALTTMVSTQPDIVVLDMMLPGMDGLEVCRRARPRFDGPVLMLTARRGDIDEVASLESGADDYVTKPVNPRVLLARIRALLRRHDNTAESTGEDACVMGNLRIDRRRREVLVGTEQLLLTSTEFEVLWLLSRRAGRVVSRDALYLDVRGIPYDGLDRGMDIHVSRLRKKLRRAGLKGVGIVAVRGEGYQLTLPREP